MKRGRRTTLPEAWARLSDTVGGVAATAEALGIPQSTFNRVARGFLAFPRDKIDTLEILVDLMQNRGFDVVNPVEDLQPVPKDYGPLRLLGKHIAEGFPIAPRTLTALRKVYSQEILLSLAESDAPPEILRAVTLLLEEP